MSRGKWLILLVFVLLPGTSLRSQQPKIASETKMVTVFATVRDKHQQIVSSLTNDDFALDEDGHPQTISYFAREKDLPLTVGLLVDTSLSQRHVLAEERSASSTFVENVLREDMKDQAFVIHFDREVELLQDLTPSRKKLEAALGLLDTPHSQDDSEGGQHNHGGGTMLYDAVYLASDELMKKQQGRKALIVLTDGVDRGSKESLPDAIEAAQRADTVVYSIYFKSEEPYGEHAGGGHGHGGWGHGVPGSGGPLGQPQQNRERPDGKKILDRISTETGGRVFEVSKKQPVDNIYTQIELELRSQYILGYTPDKSQTDADYHKIHLATKQKDMTVQARDGYYAAPAVPASK